MKQNKQFIAITGIIGSGKSTVCSILREIGEKTVSCDEINAELLRDKTYLFGLKKIFPQTFDTELHLNKAKLREMIYSSEAARNRLNEYAHPQILKRLVEKTNEIDATRIFVEVPLLTDKVFISLFDCIWVINADQNTQIKRIMARDRVSVQEAKARILSQTRIQYQKPTVHIQNRGDKDNLKQEIIRLLT